MLQHLSIQNYALIRHLELEFSQGFSVITGETGAGKSILLGALDLIVGKRADTRVLLDKSAKCIVEGIFKYRTPGLDQFFTAHDLDRDDQILVRREINAQGKSRAFINDTPVNLSVLQDLGSQLVDIHSQHQNLSVTEAVFQLAVLDSYSGILSEVEAYRERYAEYHQQKNELEQLLAREQKASAEKDFFEFLYTELENAAVKEGEQEGLEQELSVLEHAEEIRAVLFNTRQGVENEKDGLLDRLREINSGLGKLRSFNTDLEHIFDRFESIRIEMQDLLREVERFEDQVSVDPVKVTAINERLDTLYGLQQKHRVNSVGGLLDMQAELQQKLSGIESLETRIAAVKVKIEKLELALQQSATSITQSRKASIPRFVQQVTDVLQSLGMPHAHFLIEHELLAHPGKDGLDSIRFLFNANKGEAPQDLTAVASGGEKSRLMLAIKSLVSRKALLPTIVFDEIDTGVSGAVADKVGHILLDLASSMQVITITHLPQIAGKGNHHFQVYKSESENITSTHVKKLNPDERIIEIAKLLSGQEITNASVESARQLLNN